MFRYNVCGKRGFGVFGHSDGPDPLLGDTQDGPARCEGLVRQAIGKIPEQTRACACWLAPYDDHISDLVVLDGRRWDIGGKLRKGSRAPAKSCGHINKKPLPRETKTPTRNMI